MKKHILVLCAIVLTALPLCAAGPADQALQLLKEGNARYLTKTNHAERREATAPGQKPFAAVLACADSRVPVEVIFDHGIGDLFVVRVAGNIGCDSAVMGSLEYAAEHLHVPLIVILGHSNCGAVKAAVDNAPVSGHIADIKYAIHPVVCRTRLAHPGLEGDALLRKVIEDNTLQAEADLLAQSRELCQLYKDHKLKIIRAVYDLASGRVEWLE